MTSSLATTPVILLHGLLGSQRDWQAVIAQLPEISCIALDLPGHGSHRYVQVEDFAQAQQWLSDEIKRRGIERYRLVGYSLGGRLALYHASLQPAGLEALLLENSHPGLAQEDRLARRLHDEGWAHRFEREPLVKVLADWYQQGVFADLNATQRWVLSQQRLDNDGYAIAAMLRATSLGLQPDLTHWLMTTQLPITYLSGRFDHKFHQLACQLVAESSKIRHLVLDGGHNLHASQPNQFAQLLQEWAHQPTKRETS